MVKQQLAVVICAALLMGLLIGPGSAGAQSVNADVATKIRSDVQSLSVNRDQKVEVRLRDKTKLKGLITSVEPDSFNITDSKNGSSETIAYADVVQVKKASNGFSKKWLILGGVGAAAIVTWIVVKPAVCDGGAQSRGIC